jgi:hypothetical protein
MNKIKRTYLKRIFKVVVILVFFQPILSLATPAGADNVRIHTGTPRKIGDSLFSVTTEWRQDQALTYLATGMLFLSGPDSKKSPSAIKVAKKLVTGIKDSMVYLYPDWRGANPVQSTGEPEVTISNHEGFSFIYMTIKDYANQEITYDMVNKSFSSAGVEVAIDLVLASGVESVLSRRMGKTKKSTGGGDGEIQIKIDQQFITVKTKGKNIQQLEEEIASALSSATISHSPLYANLKDGNERNNPPFDGSEVQIKHLAANALTIDLTDPNLGVWIKFKFKDENKSHSIMEPASMIEIVAILALLGFGFVWFTRMKKAKQEKQ